jgi:hypothetical protein
MALLLGLLTASYIHTRGVNTSVDGRVGCITRFSGFLIHLFLSKGMIVYPASGDGGAAEARS